MDLDPIDRAAAQASFSGVVAVDAGDRRLLGLAGGFADRAHAVPNTLDTRFAIASGTKAFTALAVMRLVEEGVLDLGTRARALLGDDLPLIDDSVTVEHLLSHSSGIGDYLDEEAGGEITDYVLGVPVHTLDTAEAYLPVIDGFPQVFAPGERFAYNNGGYVVLALLAERASGVGYHELVAREVCARAGLTRTAFLRSDELPGDVALGYLDDEGVRTNVLHLPVRGVGDGGISTTVGELHAFWRALLAGRIVRPETLAAMSKPRWDVPGEGKRYGLGLYVHDAGPALCLEGYDAGVSFVSWHDPRTATTATVIGNTSEAAWPVAGLLRQVVD